MEIYGDHFMKTMLKFTLALTTSLFIFSCGGEATVEATDPGSTLTETWIITGMTAYDDVACSETELFTYGSTLAHSDAVGAITASTN